MTKLFDTFSAGNNIVQGKGRQNVRNKEEFVFFIAPPAIPILFKSNPIVIGGPPEAPTTITIKYKRGEEVVSVKKIYLFFVLHCTVQKSIIIFS